MPAIVECVPNFSEGRNKEIIDAISLAISSTDGVKLLDVDPGPSTNRTVYTFVGTPEAVVTGALNAARIAYKLIDMAKHKGEHPRLGALDVCPFIPVQEVSVEDCVSCAKRFGQLLAKELEIPVYLYGFASNKDYRKTMPQIRSGEYEGLSEKLKDSLWAPDFGPAKFVPNWGATVTGVRKFLIAYNINILGTKEQAHRIALNLREQGRNDGQQPGRLKSCQAIGWYLDEHNVSQISMNLLDSDVTPIHVAFEEAKKDAQELKLAITGSQIVGLVPLEAILQAADYYIKRDDLFVLHEDQKLQLAINNLGLNSLGPFNPRERIIEYLLAPEGSQQGPLVNRRVYQFVRDVSSRTPAPGGGSVAALVSSLGAALATMVGMMTYGKKQWEHLDAAMRLLIPPLHSAMEEILSLIDEDTNSYNDYVAALRLPADEDAHEAIVQKAAKRTVEVPLKLSNAIGKIWKPLQELSKIYNVKTKSDIQVAIQCLLAGTRGAFYNVLINLDSIDDEVYKQQVTEEAEAAVKIAEAKANEILAIVN